MKNSKSLAICYSSDDNYAPHLGVSILSLFETNKRFTEITVHILENGISVHNKRLLVNLSASFAGRVIVFWNIHPILAELKMSYCIPDSISISAYARLFITDILDYSTEKIIYADADSAFYGDLYDLWNLDISDYSLAGVEDIVVQSYKNKINLPKNDFYVNSGFLIINLKKWREQEIGKNFIEIIKMYNGVVPHHDQGIINIACANDKLILPPKYNVMTTFLEMNNVTELQNFFGLKGYYSQHEISEAIKSPIFIHFTPSFSARPWIKNSRHPYRDYYYEILGRTGWNYVAPVKDNRKLKVLVLQWFFNLFGSGPTSKLLNILSFFK